LFVIIVVHAYFIHISQGSVKTHLWRGEIYTVGRKNVPLYFCP